MIRFVFFDLDDTLLDFHKSEGFAIRETLGALGVRADDRMAERYSEINASLWRALERGEVNLETVLTRRFELLFREYGIDRSPSETRKIYESALAARHDLTDGATEVLERLSGEYRLFLASNGTARVQRERLRASGIGGYFEQRFLSEELGARKPDPAFFTAAFSKIDGFVPDHAVLIGDSPTSDILGAKRAGIRSIRFNPRGEEDPPFAIPEGSVKTLAELPALLRTL